MKLKQMKWVIALTVALGVSQASAQDAPVLKTQKDKESYAIGADLAKNLKRQGVEVETEALLSGMRDVLSGSNLLMDDDALRETLRTYQVELRRKRILPRGGTAVLAEENRTKGAFFLAQNKTNQNVVCLPSGLQYKILKTGNGPKPTLSDTVECNFRGAFIDGLEFNSSERAGQPATWKMNEVLPGWKEALQLMSVGSKWQLFVPSQLAYGEKGVVDARGRPTIGPNATLVFELELLAIK